MRKFTLLIGKKRMRIRFVYVPADQPRLPIQCHLCTAQFHKSVDWRWHCFLIHHKRRKRQAEEGEEADDMDNNSSFFDPTSTTLHLRCPACAAQFADEPALRRHLLPEKCCPRCGVNPFCSQDAHKVICNAKATSEGMEAHDVQLFLSHDRVQRVDNNP